MVDGRRLNGPPTMRNRNRGERRPNNSGRSPDGRWVAEIRDHNVVVRSADSDVVIELSNDGKEGMSYGQLQWSPDSASLVAFQTEAAEIEQVHLIRSSPKEGGRAQLESRAYALPGDKFPKHRLNLFHVTTKEHVRPDVDPFEHEWNVPRLHWSRDGRRCAYEQIDRGHQRFRLIELDVKTGQVRNLIDEHSKTFIWTAHTENDALAHVRWLDDSNEIIYSTEASGWRHLQLIDAETGTIKNQITQGQWVVRGVDEVDSEHRQIWFRASGMYEHDPYFIHYGRVNFDGSGLTWLTEGDGNHTIQYSPDRKYLIDTYSRVDAAPKIELRRVEDGKFVCALEQADIARLVQSGWHAPEVFHAKGRDGRTDIWGIICRPHDYDPNKKYPIVEDIYAGPHGSFVPKSFSASNRYASLNEAGFIVVKIDGMGTAHRSKAFQDVCWQNLKDAGFEDRILWMKAAAEKYPEMDVTRVGIYGTSAGGQNAAAAVLFHPEFYKAAVASCGCHDNRMDKASWNEQWMGYPVGPHYSACSNIDNAHRLEGKLMLIVGEMDTNVPPESTLRFADALIRADKDFDLIVVPNMGHSNGGAYGQRRMRDFFVRHLIGEGNRP